MIKGQSITELQNKVFDKIISNQDIVKSLIMEQPNFLEVTPTSEQNIILNNSDVLIRKQIFPYKRASLPTENAKTYITSSWVDFKKVSSQYKAGLVYFYINVPLSLEETWYGIRYNFIADKLDEIFCNKGIGKFEYFTRGDIDTEKGYLGHCIAFKILDFHGW